ncbi:MAG: STAS domain-containing protein [Actinomycetota bacterium]|nr:STAS domain-containing protein [Actinomycetota bacterium]
MSLPEAGASATSTPLAERNGWKIALRGELDLASAPAVRPCFEEIIRRRPACVVVDVSELSFMDSTGIALMLEAADQVPVLELANPRPIIRAVMESMGLTETLRIVP